MAKNKQELLAELEKLKAKKDGLDKKIKAGDTTEATRKDLVATSAKMLELSEEIKKIVETPNKETEEAKGSETVETKEVEKTEEVEDITKNYKVKKGEEGFYHVKLVKGSRFDPQTGKPIAKPYIQIFNVSAWKQFKANASNLGYTYEIVHNPEDK